MESLTMRSIGAHGRLQPAMLFVRAEGLSPVARRNSEAASAHGGI
jgi:hypothetical protein